MGLGCPQTEGGKSFYYGYSLELLGQPPGFQRSEGGKTAPRPAHTSSEGAGLEEAPGPATPLKEVGPLITEPVPCHIHLQGKQQAQLVSVLCLR